MDKFLDKEYHPVIEEFIINYADDEMGSVERETFEEVLLYDDDLRKLAFSAKAGKKILEQLQEFKARDGFMKRLKESISESR